MRKIIFLMRRPKPGNFSVELLFREIIENLSPEFSPVIAVSRFPSYGIARRAYNVVEAALRQGEINHVTGDVNFLTYLLRRKRTILTVLDCGRIEGNLTLRTRLIRLLWFRIPVRRCAAVTVISTDVKRQLLRHVNIDPNKIHVVPVPVPRIYKRVPKEFNAAQPVILQIGAAPNKNRARLFAALAGVPCRLCLVGRLSDAERALLDKHRLEYESHSDLSTEKMFELYAKCDVVAFPSLFEGFGMPIIEGNLVGRVVVAGNVTSMPEVAGNAACMVDPYDVDAIRAGIKRVVEDAPFREQLIANGFANARRFDARSVAQRYEEVYRLVAQGGV